MSHKSYDVLIAGSGPIGAATVYFLTQQQPNLKIGLITQDPTDDHSATYTQAGGSLRWHWDSPLKTEMTKTTADFIKQLAAQGVDLSLIEDNYLLLYDGTFTPSLNFSGKKLVEYLLGQAEANGADIIRGAKISAVRDDAKMAVVAAGNKEYSAARVLLAMGVANAGFIPGYELELEKRQLFVLDLPVGDEHRSFPHVIAKIGDGYAYVFIKQTPGGLRYVVGQEDVIDASGEPGAEDYYQKLLAAGLGDTMPFLRNASVEQIWWGIDAGNKELKTQEHGRLLAANCGSAARSAAWIGQHLARQLV